MKMRLRKKLRLGEFREYCFPVSFTTLPDLSAGERGKLFDDFLDMIVDNGLQFGGGGHDNWDGMVELCGRGSATEQHRQSIRSWPDSNEQMTNVAVGELVDAWHGWD